MRELPVPVNYDQTPANLREVLKTLADAIWEVCKNHNEIARLTAQEAVRACDSYFQSIERAEEG